MPLEVDSKIAMAKLEAFPNEILYYVGTTND